MFIHIGRLGRNMAQWNMITDLLEIENIRTGTGVEIGVDKGRTTFHLLNNTDLKLYFIDPYIGRDDRCQEITEQLAKFPNANFLRMTSSEAANVVPDELDFVFIDGDHSYEGVKEDLEKWVPKVRSQGLVMGHDWNHYRPGVVQAGYEYLSRYRELFEPLMSKEELSSVFKNYPKSVYRHGSWDDDENLIHKQSGGLGGFW